jgi:ubiquinone/menaquinone biosynthesis C-methylase UbiE
MLDAQLFKQNERRAWDSCAETYDRCLTPAFTPIARELISLVGLHSGQRVLDVATGGGLVALLAASLVGPEGRVLGVDLAETMVALARNRAGEEDVHNAEFSAMDAENLDLPPEYFDAVLCSLGLMLFPQPERALGEMHRVLKAGGSVAVAVFDRGSKVALRALIEPFVPLMPPPPQRGPSIFGYGPSEVLAEALQGAGFSDVATEQNTHVLTFNDTEGVWEMILSLGRLAQMHSDLPAEAQGELKQQVVRLARDQYTNPHGALELPCEITYATARR